jgi:AcrR family transcriptional regulator
MIRTVVRLSNSRSISRPGPERARRRADQRRREILRAAARIFRERGFALTGMRDIAQAADLSSGNLYHYFRGKDEILFACQDESLDRLLEALRRVRRGDGPLGDRLHALATAHLHCLLDEFEGSAAHFEVDVLPAPLRKRIVAKRDLYERGTRALVREGVRRGDLRAADPAMMTRAFFGALNWTAHWFRPGGPQSSDVVAANVASYAVAGLMARGDNNGAPTGRKRSRPRGRAAAR